MAAVVPAPEGITRTRILDAAEARFAAFGYRRTGIAEIARQAGIAAGTIYRYFASKEDVFRAVIARLNEGWLECARAAVAGPGTPVERLMRMGQASVEFNQQNSLLNSVFRRDDEIVCAPLIEELHAQLVTQNVALIADVIRAGIRDGTLRDVDPERAAFILYLGGEALSNQRRYPYEDVIPIYGQIMLEGLLRPSRRRTR